MSYSRSSGASRGTRRSGRWFVLVFLCMVLMLAVVPAASLGHATAKCTFQQSKVTLSASRGCVTSGTSVKLTAKASHCPSGATFTLLSKGSSGTWATVGTSPASKCGTAVFNVVVVRNTQFQAKLTWPQGSQTSNVACVKVCAKLTLCVAPPTYGGVAISGTLVPGWNGGNVCITIAKVVHCWRTAKVATLTAPLTQGPGDSSVFATSWAGGMSNTTYVFTAKVAKTADFNGACVTKVVKF